MKRLLEIAKSIEKLISNNLDVKYFIKKENNYYIINFISFTNQIDYTITLLFKEDKKDYIFCPIQYQINYNLLDNILDKVLVNNKLLPSYEDKDNRWDSFFVEKQTNLYCSIIDDNVFDIFKEQYLKNILPFFEKWKDLTVLYEYIKGKERREELSEILGQFWQFKKAAILRLCNDSNYQDFMNDYYEKQKEYYEEDPEDIDNIRYYNAAKELKEVLDKTAPIYNV
ncbi:hypothetical protein ACT4R9_07435 [Ornithobacterium rhinotracheale]|uniref:hypothetical protein n=1 Tax=Ornithobacterium rhinotracheale TaxID=28251 RepID=UPI003FCEF557